mgnify:CR=1 FL=1
MKSEIAENVKSIIKEKGLLQKAVAKRAGYGQKAFNNMLNNRKVITDRDIIPIAKALDVEPNVLFGHQGGDKSVWEKRHEA